MKLIKTNRKYKVIGFDGSNEPFEILFTLEELLTEDKEGLELLYSLQEDINRYIDMAVRDCKYIYCSRDDKSALGIIKRIS